MNLEEHYDGQGWLTAGWYKVAVKDFRLFQYNTGSDGVEFELADARGLSAKASFCLHDNALWKLAQFSKACNLAREKAKNYDHPMLIGKEVVVRVVPDGKFHVVDDWASADTDINTLPPVPPPQPASAVDGPAPLAGKAIPF